MIWCLHGAFGCASDWAFLPKRLGELAVCRPVSVFDIEPEASWEAWTDAFTAKVSAVDDSPLLLGYSMGGRLALMALLAKPAMWRAAVIVSAHPGLTSDAEREARLAKDAQWLAELDTLPWPAFWQKWCAQSNLKGPPRQLPTFHPQMRQALLRFSLGNQTNEAHALASLRTRLLWITGEQDAKFTQLANKVCHDHPTFRHVVISDCGHRVPWEQPESFSQQVRHYLQTLSTT